MTRTPGVSAGLLALALAVGLATTAPARSSSAAGVLDGRSICIDAGHGGSEPGAVHGGIEEQAINLDVARYLEGAFTADGAVVTMTRTAEEQTLSSRDRYSRCNEAGSDILVSVHTNAASSVDLDGTLSIYFHDDDRVLAGFLQASMYGSLSTNGPEGGAFVNFGLKRDALGVLLKSGMPAATVEPVMMSNAGELDLLRTAIDDTACAGACRRVQIAESVRAGVLEYFASVPPGGDGGGGGDGGCKPAWHPKCAGEAARNGGRS